MNKKGFTLAELLAVIVLLSFISILIVPTVSKFISNNKEKTHDLQIDNIIKAAKIWSVSNSDLLTEEDYYLSVEELINKGFIEQEDIIDPNGSDLKSGCVKIKYTELYKQYEYIYQEVCDEFE